MITHEKEEKVIAQNAETDIEIAELKALLASSAADSLQQDLKSQIENLEETQKSRISNLHEPLFSGFLKFMLLLILEIVIYHFSVKTDNILKGKTANILFDDFVRAEIRMLKVMARNALLGWIAWLILKIAFGIFGLTFLHDAAYYMVTAFYIGFAFLDNYLELHDISISKSAVIVRSHIGGTLMIGLIASVFLLVPIVGPLLIPVLCSIAATRYAHQFRIEEHSSVEIMA